MADDDEDGASVRQRNAAIRTWRRKRIKAFLELQRKGREWISFTEIADHCAREGGSIVPDEQRRKRAYAELSAAILRGDFDQTGRSHVLFLSEHSCFARMTAERLRDIQGIAGWTDDGTIDRQYLACCWVPAAMARAWFGRLNLPPLAHLLAARQKIERARAVPKRRPGRPTRQEEIENVLRDAELNQPNKVLIQHVQRMLGAGPGLSDRKIGRVAAELRRKGR